MLENFKNRYEILIKFLKITPFHYFPQKSSFALDATMILHFDSKINFYFKFPCLIILSFQILNNKIEERRKLARLPYNLI